MTPRANTMPPSVARRITILFRRMTSKTSRGSAMSSTTEAFSFKPAPSPSCVTGENSGVEVPDNDSLSPLNPLCGAVLGAGSPFQKCSSSASDPLSLDCVVESLSTGGYAEGDRKSPPSSSDFVVRAEPFRKVKVSEGWGRSKLWWWYGWGDRERRRRRCFSSESRASCDSGLRCSVMTSLSRSSEVPLKEDDKFRSAHQG
jgi:hypothetical protein